MHPFDQAMTLTRVNETTLTGTTSDAYWNFAGPFGGYIAALLMQSVLLDPRRLGPPVAQTVNYCGAAAKGSFAITASLDRGGKATQHWSMRMTQGDQVVATGSIVCANRRDTFAHQTITKPLVPPPDAVQAAPPVPHLPWLSAYEFRFIEGGPEFGAVPRPAGDLGSSSTKLWLRERPERPLDFASLAALSDCFILRLVQMRRSLPPMGTVSMTTYFHAREDELAAQGSQLLLGIADAKRFSANFHDQSMQLWGTDGRLIANGIQTVWFKA